MEDDVLLQFYVSSVKVQSYEYHLCHSRLPGKSSATLLHEMEAVRRELGAAVLQLMNAAIPSSLRNRRLFRTKYTEEVDLYNLERCLVAAANRVTTPGCVITRDHDLRPALPSANRFLDVLSEVQCSVSSLVESEVAKRDKLSELKTDDSPAPKETSAPAQSAPSDADESLFANPASLRVRAAANDSQSKPAKDSSSRSTPEQSDAQASTSASSSQPVANGITTTKLEIIVDQNVFYEEVRLPPSSSLSISDRLFTLLLELDESAARFEYNFVRALSRRLRTIQEAEDLQVVTVLFSETLMWCLAVRLLSVRQLADRDPAVLLSLPRLAILVGTRLLPDSPIGSNLLASGQRLPFMFASSRADLAYLARQMNALRLDQLCRLARWLGPRGLPNLVSSHSPSSPTQKAIASNHSRSHATSLFLSPRRGRTNSDRPLTSSWCASSPESKRATWRTNLLGLHRIYKSVSTVADRVANEFPTELRFILQAVIEMHDTSNEDEALAEQAKDLGETTVDASGSQTEPAGDSDEDASNETELESELHVDEELLHSNKNFSSLATLLDWAEVMSKHDLKASLSEALKKSNPGTASTLSKTDKPSSPSAPSTEAPSLDPYRNSSSVEYGLDVAAWLSDSEASSYSSALSDPPNSWLSQRLKKPASQDPTEPEHESTLSRRLQKLNLGVSVEGKRRSVDNLFHYLPPWQPDRINHTPRVHRSSSRSSLSQTTDSDEECVQESSDEKEDENSYVVGRQCASCLRAFTLLRRRHHCRRCGHIFCGRCCNHWQTVEGLATIKPVRICSECHLFLNPEAT
ncbi:unnamed protein product [Calicophoron daubneyi]|uniref:FYVE-type domain-containing protein n=1 Tax=Calicophoron daubneyi TaxID=300641 RepID=A0AAV2T2I0_CALDB